VTCSRIKSIDRFNDKESSLFARESIKSTNKSHLLYWRLNITLYVFLLQSSSIIIRSILFQTNLIMLSHSSTEEHFEEFRNRFFQISDADSSKSSSVASFIQKDDESFIEMIILLMFYEIWKTWSLALDEETDQLYELNKQQEDEIKELKTRLQAKEITSSDSIYSERSRSQKISNSSLFTDEKNSTWKNWYGKIQNKLEINVDLFSNKLVKLSYIYSRLFNDAAEITQAKRERDYINLYKIVNNLLKKLTQLFDDSNKKVNFRRKYYNLIQEFKKFKKFYIQFQRLSFYLDYHEKQLITDLKDKIHSRLRFVWVNQLVQSDFLKEIRFYLICLNNNQRVIREIKNKIKRVDNLSKTIFHKATIVTQSVDHSKSDQLKSRDLILTNVKEADILVESCFICHKSDHSSKECLDRFTRINVVNNEYDCFDFDSNFNSKN